ncbi:MAG: FHA domain-containing protein [Sulfurimicrobium sp.]
MSKLVLHGTSGADREIMLDRERITIGRKAHNDIHLDGAAVSGEHAVIITLGSDSFLEDLHSTNGTQVNQATVHKCVLRDGDEIGIAGYRLTFVSEPAAQSAPGKTLCATPKSRIDPRATHPATLMDAVTLMPESTRLAPDMPGESFRNASNMADGGIAPGNGTLGVIRILSGPGSNQRLELSKPVTTLGKPGIQVVAISLRDGRYYLGVVEGETLPRVNGSEVKALPYLLQPRDIIDIAGIELEFTLK